MTLLDTDHFSALQFAESNRAVTLANRLDQIPPGEACISVVTVEEQLRGWLAAIHACKTDAAQVPLYTRLAVLVKVFADWRIVEFDAEAAVILGGLRKRKLRLGTMDLKIAAIALRHDALLLTANASDFSRVPGLRIANWLEASTEP